ncbi:MAG: exodeoxyribonuclease III [Bacteroidota bacterium]|nr:exodeoxyribonuclease III [Bacteroidota bacterium]
MRIISYNVNGLRSAQSKGLESWLHASNPDVFCMQEIKATPDVVDVKEFEKMGYKLYWYPAEKKGYSGVAIFSKIEPQNVSYGCGMQAYDIEGRVIRADFKDFSIMNVYMPSGTTGDERQQFKYKWLDDFYNYANALKKQTQGLIIVGDYNICHKPIDIHNPVSNAKSSGFLPEERAWMESFFNSGFVDTFRHFNKEPHNYTWWSYRAGSRAKNLGWRIDYQSASENLTNRLTKAMILSEAKHSDHCPTLLEIN